MPDRAPDETAIAGLAAGRRPAVLGVADHNGWAVCVTVAANGNLPVVVDRRRLELIEPGLPTNPYHHEALELDRPAAEALVARVRDSVLRTTRARLTELLAALRPAYTLVAMTLRIPPLPYVPITVAEAHASRYVMVRADGMLYHDALSIAAEHLGLPVALHERGEAITLAAARLGVSPAEVERFFRAAGQPLGPPWQQEHRFAAAAATTHLADHVRISLSI